VFVARRGRLTHGFANSRAHAIFAIERGRCGGALQRASSPCRLACARLQEPWSQRSREQRHDDERNQQDEHGPRQAPAIRRLVYLSGLHPEGVDLSPHLASRKEVGDILLTSPTPTLVLQAGVVIGSGSASFEMVRHLTDVLPYMPAPRWVRDRIQPIAVRDVLYYLLAAARVAPDLNRALDVGGPDVLRYDQMTNGYAIEAGLPRRRIAALPVLTPKLASYWVYLVTPFPRQIARPLVESLQHPCVMRDHAIDAIVPPPPGGLTGYREAVRLALGRIELDVVETSWVDTSVTGAPSEPLPNDPDWAGRTVFTDTRRRRTSSDAAAAWACSAGAATGRGWSSVTRSTCGGWRRWSPSACCDCAPRYARRAAPGSSSSTN